MIIRRQKSKKTKFFSLLLVFGLILCFISIVGLVAFLHMRKEYRLEQTVKKRNTD